MPNHIRLLVVPSSAESLRDGISQVHQSYTRYLNKEKKWTGHLWQGRFFSCPVEPERAVLVARYIELNPVRAKLCTHPRGYSWSSADMACNGSKHGENDFSNLVSPQGSWEDFLMTGAGSEEFAVQVRKNSSTGRPLGSLHFVQAIEKKLGVSLATSKPGPQKKHQNQAP